MKKGFEEKTEDWKYNARNWILNDGSVIRIESIFSDKGKRPWIISRPGMESLNERGVQG